MQDQIATQGFAIQCRVTTEDPANGFVPDYGRLTAYRSSGGPGVRLDGGTAFGGALITPYYDSLLVKVTASGRRFADAATRMERCLQEFRIRGVKTNIPFLLNLIDHPEFLAGNVTTRFLDETPDLFKLSGRRDRATKLLGYVADVIVNGHPEVREGVGDRVKVKGAQSPGTTLSTGFRPSHSSRREPVATSSSTAPRNSPSGSATRAASSSPTTAMRDAHQSLLTTRMRTADMLAVAFAAARARMPTSSPSKQGMPPSTRRCASSRSRRGTASPGCGRRCRTSSSRCSRPNAVGYSNYPDNVVDEFVRLSAQHGMDIFRVFDANNWLPNLRVGVEAVLKTDAICEAAVCYTGDILDPRRATSTR